MLYITQTSTKYIIKVDIHLVLNGINHDVSADKRQIYFLGVIKCRKKYMLTDSFFCHSTSTEGTYHHQFGKCVRFPIFRLQAKILSSFQTKRFQCPFEKIHSTEYNLGKYLETRKELTRYAWSKPLQKCWTGVTFGHLS